MRRLLAILILLAGCTVPATPWVQTWADAAPAVYRASVVSDQLEILADYVETYGPTRAIQEVVYFVRRWLPWSPRQGGWCSWDDVEDEATIYIGVHRADHGEVWRHELHHARIGDANHRDPSWAALRSP